MVIPDAFRQCVAILYTEHLDEGSGSRTLAPRGTAFFVTYPTSRIPDQQFVYLITAKHNILRAQTVADRLGIRVNTQGESAGYTWASLRDESPWALHPDPTVDVAAVPFAPDPGLFDHRAIGTLQFASRDGLKQEKPPVGPGDSVFFIGLFPQHAGPLRNYPIARFGQISLMLQELRSSHDLTLLR